MHIIINYDVSTMSSPSISATGLLEAHCRVRTMTTEGTIELTATGSTAIGEYGNLAMIDFDPVSADQTAVINSVSVVVTDSGGGQFAVPVVINNPKPQAKASGTPSDAADSAKDSVWKAGDGGATGGPGALPDKSAPTGRTPENPASGNSASAPGSSAAEGALGGTRRNKTAPCEVLVCSGLLDRVREGSAPKNALQPATREADCRYRQEPEAILSDGRSTVRIIMELEVKGDTAPNFFIEGAHCLSLKRVAKAWELELLPSTGAFAASVSALFDDRIVQFPLTVAPPIAPYRNRRPNPPVTGLETYLEMVNAMVRNLAEVRH